MSGKSVILTIIAAALFFGGMISGCNRNRDNRVAMNNRRQPRADSPRAPAAPSAPRGVRPAEVLSASVKRPRANRQYSSAPTMASAPYTPPQPVRSAYPHPNAYAQQPIYTVSTSKIYEPLPEPIPVPNAPVYTGPVMYAGPTYHSSESPVYISEPYVLDPVPMPVSSTPELAMARAALEPIQVPNTYIPQVQQLQAPPPVMRQEPVQRVPLPELEPVRYHRVANTPASSPQAVPVMMSTVPAQWDAHDRRDVQRALAPLAQPNTSTSQNWVSGPTTAFRF